MARTTTPRGRRGLGPAAVLLASVLFAAVLVTVSPSGAQEADEIPVEVAAAPVAGKTERVTRSLNGEPVAPGDQEIEHLAVSEHGRFVAYDSEAVNLVPNGPHPNAERSVYVTDRLLGTTQMVSVASNEAKGNGFSWDPSISDDGRFIAFYSEANNLVPGDTNGKGDIFVRDLVAGTTQRVSVTSSEAQFDEYSDQAHISGNGNVVAFTTQQAAVITDDNGLRDVYVRDLGAGTTGRVSLPATNVTTDGEAANPVLDRDGSIVVLESAATNMVPGDSNGFVDLFVRDRTAGTTERVSLDTSEGQGDLGASEDADVSANGRYVAFHSAATDLVPGAGASTFVVVVRDRQAGTTELQSRLPNGTPALRGFNPTISANGQRVAFMSRTSDLVPPGGCEPYGVVRDRPSGVIQRAFPTQPNFNTCSGRDVIISPDGRYLVASEFEAKLLPPDPGDVDGYDVYLRMLANSTFSDVPVANAFFEHISWLVDTGVTTGFLDGTFKPSDPVTRGAMAAFLYRYTDASFVPSGQSFSDVPAGHTFYEEIEWMADEGFTGGFNDGTFRPANPVTREAMAAFIYRLAGSPNFTPPATPTFNDVPTNHLFRKEIEWMAANGLASGFSDGGFHPGESIARQATAAFLFRFELVMG